MYIRFIDLFIYHHLDITQKVTCFSVNSCDRLVSSVSVRLIDPTRNKKKKKKQIV